jgi:ABC-type Fe3+ transport system substrate-binding protein
MRALSKQVALVPKPPDPPDAVGRGQYAIALAAIIQRALPLRAEGAPLRFVSPKEGYYLVQAGIAFVRSAPHPNAAKLFLNWFYTKEGQTVFGKTAGVISLRKDVPQDYLPEDLRYVEGAPVMEIDLQDLLDPERNQQMRQLAKEIFEGGK